jgi:hypothetical protein
MNYSSAMQTSTSFFGANALLMSQRLIENTPCGLFWAHLAKLQKAVAKTSPWSLGFLFPGLYFI